MLDRRDVKRALRRIGDRIKAVATAVWAWIVRAYQWLTGALKRRAVIARLLPADIILASPRTMSLSPIALVYRLLLKAQYVHSMLYVGNGKILHTTTRYGVVVTRVPRGIHRKDRYTILRDPDLGYEQRVQVVRAALEMTDRKLDHLGLATNIPAKLLGLRKPLVRMEQRRLWCGKLINEAYGRAGVELVPPDLTGTVTSEDLSRSSKLEPV